VRHTVFESTCAPFVEITIGCRRYIGKFDRRRRRRYTRFFGLRLSPETIPTRYRHETEQAETEKDNGDPARPQRARRIDRPEELSARTATAAGRRNERVYLSGEHRAPDGKPKAADTRREVLYSGAIVATFAAAVAGGLRDRVS